MVNHGGPWERLLSASLRTPEFGSCPTPSANHHNAGLAQLVERRFRNSDVRGSIPLASTTVKKPPPSERQGLCSLHQGLCRCDRENLTQNHGHAKSLENGLTLGFLELGEGG